MKIISLFEPASSDGYKHFGDGVFHLSASNADQAAKNKHGGYAVEPIKHDAIEFEDGRYLLLKSTKPVSIVGTTQATEDIAKAALEKLTPAERVALGLNVKDEGRRTLDLANTTDPL